MKSIKKEILLAAISGVALGATVPTTASAAKIRWEKCWGIQACKAHSTCHVSKEDIDKANKSTKNKFKKTGPHACAGQGRCAASKGELGWVKVAEGACKDIENGLKL